MGKPTVNYALVNLLAEASRLNASTVEDLLRTGWAFITTTDAPPKWERTWLP